MSADRPAVPFGRLLVRLRDSRRWNQRELAKRLGMPPATISAWETGRSMPEAMSLLRLAEVFDTTVGNMLNEAGLQPLVDEAAPLRYAAPCQGTLSDIPVYRFDQARFDPDGRPQGHTVTVVPRASDNTDSASYGLLVEGSALYPRIWPGDVIVASTTLAMQPGELAVVICSEPPRVLVRRLRPARRGVMVVVPLNPSEESEEIAMAACCVHKILAIYPRGAYCKGEDDSIRAG